MDNLDMAYELESIQLNGEEGYILTYTTGQYEGGKVSIGGMSVLPEGLNIDLNVIDANGHDEDELLQAVVNLLEFALSEMIKREEGTPDESV